MNGPRIALLLGLSLVAASVAAQGTQLYRWVDENGKVHYGDRLETPKAASDHDRFNAHGIRLSPGETEPTREERLEREQKRRTAYRDSALMSGYGSELELLRAHDEQRATMEQSLRTSQSNIDRLKREVNDRVAAGSTPASDPALATLNQQLEAEEKTQRQLQKRRFELYETQNREVERYRELSEKSETSG